MQIPGALRAAGVVFREDFRNAALSAKNGWRFTGSPNVADGVVVGSSEDAYTSEIDSYVFSPSTGYTVRLDVTPAFAAASGTDRYLVFAGKGVAAADISFSIRILTNNILVLYGGGGTTILIGSATWIPLWNEYGRNTLICSVKSGDTTVWLNGTKIADGVGTAFTDVSALRFVLGARYDHLFSTVGTYHEVLVVDHAIDDLDEPVLRNNTLLSDIRDDRNLIILPMERDYAISGVQSMPLEGTHKLNQEYATMGDGVPGGGTVPPKLATKYGYRFDGSDDRIVIPNHADLVMTDGIADIPWTASFVFELDSLGAATALFCKGDGATDCDWLIYVSSGGALVVMSGDPVAGGYVYGSTTVVAGQVYRAIFTSDGSGTIAGHKIYLFGLDATTGGSTNGLYVRTRDSGYDVTLGVDASIGWDLAGAIRSRVRLMRNFSPSPMQARAMDYELAQEVGL